MRVKLLINPLNNDTGLDLADKGQVASLPSDLKGWFGDEEHKLPLELEIGTGRGDFIMEQAGKFPEVNYIGIEWSLKFWSYVVNKCSALNLKNIKLLRMNAEIFIKNHTGNNTFREIHIYFPDPWPKRRHNNRRLIKEPFLRELHRVLENNGLIRIATDHRDYYKWIENHSNKVSDLFERLPFTSPEAAKEGELVGTSFERKYRREGREFYSLILKKK